MLTQVPRLSCRPYLIIVHRIFMFYSSYKAQKYVHRIQIHEAFVSSNFNGRDAEP